MLRDVTPSKRTPPKPGRRRPAPSRGDGRHPRLRLPSPRSLLPAVGAAAAGTAVTLAFPPTDLWWAAPLGLALLIGILRGRGPWAGAGLGLVFGIAFFTPLLHFTAVAMSNPIGWAALTAVESLYIAALGAAWTLISRLPALNTVEAGRPTVGRVVSFAVLWCGVEELRSSWPWGGFPFGRLAFAMSDAPALPFAAYGGSIGLSLLVALAAACLVEVVTAVRARTPLPAAGAAACAAVALLAPSAIPLDTAPQDGTLRVGAVQGDVAKDFEDAFERAQEVTGNHVLATQELADDVGPGTLDVVIWPENAADLDPRTHPSTAALVEEAAQAVDTQVLVGAVLFEDDVRYNDMIVWTPGQGAGAYYRKHQPVPFAEYVPLRDLVSRVTDQADRIGTDMAPGTGPRTLTVHAAPQDRDVPLAMGICFEVAYDDALRRGVEEGGELVVIPTNNASFLDSSEADQQLAQGRVQAVVHGRSVVQVSTVGITAVIDPAGTVEQHTEPYTRASLVADVGLRTSRTPADVLGQWPGLVLCAAAALLTAAGIVSGARRRPGAPSGRPRRPANRRNRTEGKL